MTQKKSKIEVHYDVGANVSNQIESFYHCAKCLEELPPGVSPMEYARTQAGITKEGHIQIWCNRHNLNVALLTLKLKETVH
jgi:hypothetical protein